MRTMSTKVVRFIEAMVLVLGFSACSATTAQKHKERQMSPEVDQVAVSEQATTPSTAFDAPPVADSDASFVLSSSLEQVVIRCSFQVDNPHKSHHVPGTVNVVARVNCSAPVSEIQMRVGLELDGVEVARSTVGISGGAFLRGNAATPCINGTYQGTARVIVTFPPGYDPRTGTGSVASPRIAITC